MKTTFKWSSKRGNGSYFDPKLNHFIKAPMQGFDDELQLAKEAIQPSVRKEKIMLKFAYWLLWKAERLMGCPISKEDSKKMFDESVKTVNMRHANKENPEEIHLSILEECRNIEPIQGMENYAIPLGAERFYPERESEKTMVKSMDYFKEGDVIRVKGTHDDYHKVNTGLKISNPEQWEVVVINEK